MKGKDKKIIAKLEQKSEIMSKKINNALYDFIEAFPGDDFEEDYRVRDMAVFKVFTNIVPIILDAGYGNLEYASRFGAMLTKMATDYKKEVDSSRRGPTPA